MEGIKKLANMWGLVRDPDLENLFPRDAEQFKRLEAQIVREGCRTPLIADRATKTLVDGYCRLDICERRGVAFYVDFMDFKNRTHMFQSSYDWQVNRRNLIDAQRIEAAMKVENVVKAEAAKRASPGTNQYTERSAQNFAETSGDSRDELAAIAKVSHTTYDKGSEVFKSAPEEVKDMYRAGELSTYAAHKVTHMDKEKQDEFIKRTKEGEKPKEVIRSITGGKGVSDNPNGFPASVRKSQDETRKIYEEMRSGNVVHEFTIDDLTEDIRVNADVYIGMLDSTLKERSELITIETSHKVASAIDVVIDKITKIRRRYA